jgi:hypothetical protein
MSATKYVPKAVREAYEMGMRAGRKEVNTEMLEALKYVVQYHQEHDSGEGELFGLDFVTTCIGAIRKAERGAS